MKKLCTILVSVIMVMSLLAGCGNSTEETSSAATGRNNSATAVESGNPATSTFNTPTITETNLTVGSVTILIMGR